MGNKKKFLFNNEEKKVEIKIVERFGEKQFEIFPKIINATKTFKSKNIENILDLGCGFGTNTLYLAEEGFQLWAGDKSEKCIDKLKSKVKKLKIENVNYKEIDMRDIPFKDNSFDAVICVSTLEHGAINEIKSTINEIFRVLKPGGILITDLLSIEDDSFGLGEEIEKNTFVGGREGEEGIPHFYTTDKEIKELFKKFEEVKVSKTDYIFELIDGKEFISKAFDICCLKG